MGKYLRHAIAAILGFLAAAAVKAAGVEVSDDSVQGFVGAATDMVAPLVLVWIYAWGEKLLKRFEWLDREGYTDRASLKFDSRVLQSRSDVGR